jgi:RNA-directed DNA polymerase
LNVSRDYVMDLRNVLYIWKRHGSQAALERFHVRHGHRNAPPAKPLPSFAQIIAGRVQYVGAIKGWSHPVYRTLANQLHELHPDFRPHTLRTLLTKQRVTIYTEGKTDPMHLLAAQRHFHANGRFTNLVLETVAGTPAGSGKKLLDLTRALALTTQAIPSVSLFDRDEPSVVDDAVGATGSRNYGRRVGAVAIAYPAWRDDAKPLCIEVLYRDADLQLTDTDKRRIYLLEEFNLRSGYHLSDPVVTPNPKNRTLVRDEVFAQISDDNLALSKIRFAEYVERRAAPYDAIDFEGFVPTFEAIQDIAARLV